MPDLGRISSRVIIGSKTLAAGQANFGRGVPEKQKLINWQDLVNIIKEKGDQELKKCKLTEGDSSVKRTVWRRSV